MKLAHAPRCLANRGGECNCDNDPQAMLPPSNLDRARNALALELQKRMWPHHAETAAAIEKLLDAKMSEVLEGYQRKPPRFR